MEAFPEYTNSHSTMYLLKLAEQILKRRLNKFTFHHVSIKTQIKQIRKEVDINSHSTMYLLKLIQILKLSCAYYHSHSTMYLLKRRNNAEKELLLGYSHSTIYLLKPC